jgi:N6-L-threonylcarbamoyladenine synthase
VASYQRAIVGTLVAQTRKAAERLHPASILLVGGVACNSELRETFKREFERVYYPRPVLTTDNAAMIAAAGTPRLAAHGSVPLDLNAYADLPLCFEQGKA